LMSQGPRKRPHLGARMIAIFTIVGTCSVMDELWLDLSHDKPIPRPSSGQSGRMLTALPE
jgi:hypothetical protein